jgi:hypothetical protein
VVERDPKSLILVVADMARSNRRRPVRLSRSSCGVQGKRGPPVLIEQWLAEFGVNVNQP